MKIRKSSIKASASGAKYAPIVTSDFAYLKSDILRYVGKEPSALRSKLEDLDFREDGETMLPHSSYDLPMEERWSLDTEAGSVKVKFWYTYYTRERVDGRIRHREGEVSDIEVTDNQDACAIRDEESRLFSSKEVSCSTKRRAVKAATASDDTVYVIFRKNYDRDEKKWIPVAFWYSWGNSMTYGKLYCIIEDGIYGGNYITDECDISYYNGSKKLLPTDEGYEDLKAFAYDWLSDHGDGNGGFSNIVERQRIDYDLVTDIWHRGVRGVDSSTVSCSTKRRTVKAAQTYSGQSLYVEENNGYTTLVARDDDSWFYYDGSDFLGVDLYGDIDEIAVKISEALDSGEWDFMSVSDVVEDAKNSSDWHWVKEYEGFTLDDIDNEVNYETNYSGDRLPKGHDVTSWAEVEASHKVTSKRRAIKASESVQYTVYDSNDEEIESFDNEEEAVSFAENYCSENEESTYVSYYDRYQGEYVLVDEFDSYGDMRAKLGFSTKISRIKKAVKASMAVKAARSVTINYLDFGELGEEQKKQAVKAFIDSGEAYRWYSEWLMDFYHDRVPELAGVLFDKTGIDVKQKKLNWGESSQGPYPEWDLSEVLGEFDDGSGLSATFYGSLTAKFDTIYVEEKGDFISTGYQDFDNTQQLRDAGLTEEADYMDMILGYVQEFIDDLWALINEVCSDYPDEEWCYETLEANDLEFQVDDNGNVVKMA